MRDNFSIATKEALAARVGLRCSNPACRQLTSGPKIDPGSAINVGVAAHITAASTGGPRYEKALAPGERRGADNGIWLCQKCAKLVDSDPLRYPTQLLHEWKRNAEQSTLAELEGKPGSSQARPPLTLPDLLDSYGRTTIDLWRLGTSAFVLTRRAAPAKYLSPYLHFAANLVLILLLLATFESLRASVMARHGKPSFDVAAALASQAVVGFVLWTCWSLLLAIIFSRLWPMRKRLELPEIFEFMCYYSSFLLPLAAMDVVLTPKITELAEAGELPHWADQVPDILGFFIGVAIFLVYWIPGISALAGVSRVRVLIGHFFLPNLAIMLLVLPAVAIALVTNEDFVRSFKKAFVEEFVEGYERGFRFGREARRRFEDGKKPDTPHGEPRPADQTDSEVQSVEIPQPMDE